MKNRRIAVCVLSAALTIGAASMTAYAAEGWQQSQTGTGWVYLDSNGNKCLEKGCGHLVALSGCTGKHGSQCVGRR